MMNGLLLFCVNTAITSIYYLKYSSHNYFTYTSNLTSNIR